jgi:radical SAM protein with 4Fe4S-binding SPASM domain
MKEALFAVYIVHNSLVHIKQLYAESRTSGIEFLSTAPQYARVVLQQSEGYDAAPNHFYLGVNQGNELKPIAEFIGGCGAGRLYCALQPNGYVTPCVFIPQWIIGNIRENSFTDIWANIESDAEYACFKSRESLTGACGQCQYRYVCGGCRARALGYFDDPAASDIGCINNTKLWEEVSQKCEHNRAIPIAT